MESVEPRVHRVLEKVSATIDKTEERYGEICTVLHCTVMHCAVQYCIVLYCTVLYRYGENDRKELHELEWKQVALVIGTTVHQTLSGSREELLNF